MLCLNEIHPGNEAQGPFPGTLKKKLRAPMKSSSHSCWYLSMFPEPTSGVSALSFDWHLIDGFHSPDLQSYGTQMTKAMVTMLVYITKEVH